MAFEEELIPVGIAMKELGIARSSFQRAVAKAGVRQEKRGFITPAQFQVLREVVEHRQNNGLAGAARVGGNGTTQHGTTQHGTTQRCYRVSVQEEGRFYTKRIGLTAEQAKAAIKMYESYGLKAVAIKYK